MGQISAYIVEMPLIALSHNDLRGTVTAAASLGQKVDKSNVPVLSAASKLEGSNVHTTTWRLGIRHDGR